MSFEIVNNPAKLAEPVAEMLFFDSVSLSKEDYEEIQTLNQSARMSKFLGTWKLSAIRGFVVPSPEGTHVNETITNLFGVEFTGDFEDYRPLFFNKAAQDKIAALCLVFPSGSFNVPKKIELDKNDLFCVPVLAVEEMTRPEQ